MSDICDIFSRDEVIEKRLFGNGNAPQFVERIGDFVLIPKDDYGIFHHTLGEDMDIKIGFHGGLHEWETVVPLIRIDC